MITTTTKKTPSLIVAHIVGLALLTLILQGFLSFSTITDALGFYGVYHRDPTNQLIHFFGVPFIIWSMIVFLAHLNVPRLPLPLPLPLTLNKLRLPGTKPHRITYASIVVVIYIGFYLYLDSFGGILYAPFAYGMYVTAVNFTMKDQTKALRELKQTQSIDTCSSTGKISTAAPWSGTGRALKLAGIVHLLGWYVQIHPGHGIYEGAKPAVLQSIGGALTAAPLFAYYEGLWWMGLNKGLQLETKLLVDEYTVDLCRNGAKMRACRDYGL